MEPAELGIVNFRESRATASVEVDRTLIERRVGDGCLLAFNRHGERSKGWESAKEKRARAGGGKEGKLRRRREAAGVDAFLMHRSCEHAEQRMRSRPAKLILVGGRETWRKPARSPQLPSRLGDFSRPLRSSVIDSSVCGRVDVVEASSPPANCHLLPETTQRRRTHRRRGARSLRNVQRAKGLRSRFEILGTIAGQRPAGSRRSIASFSSSQTPSPFPAVVLLKPPSKRASVGD